MLRLSGGRGLPWRWVTPPKSGGRRRWAVRAAVAVLALGGPPAVLGPAPVARAGSTCFGAPITIIGSEGADTIKGTSGPDVIDGEGGDDIIDGGGGDDRICGSAGDDTIQGGSGTDRCDGGTGHDTAAGCESTSSIP
jgi:Ca2+-binding RTX toxin-like protein